MDTTILNYNSPIYIGWSATLKCRGVFASKPIKKGDTVEPCPIILIKHNSEANRIAGCPSGNIIDNYYYDWNKKFWCLPLGFAMLYNHSYHPNMKYLRNFKKQLLTYIAIKDIAQDEELTVNYNGKPDDQSPIDSWFKEYDNRKII